MRFTDSAPGANPLAELRRELGLTRVDLAVRLGTSVGYLSLAERGAIAFPRAIWDALERAGVDVDPLMERYDEWRRAQVTPLEAL